MRRIFPLALALLKSSYVLAMPDILGTYRCQSATFKEPAEITLIQQNEFLMIKGMHDGPSQGLPCANNEGRNRSGIEEIYAKAECDETQLSFLTISTNLRTQDSVRTFIKFTKKSDKKTEIQTSITVKTPFNEKKNEILADCERPSSAG